MEKILEYVRALENNPVTLGFTWEVSSDYPKANVQLQPQRNALLWWKWDDTEDGVHGWHLSVFHTEIRSRVYLMTKNHRGAVTEYYSSHWVEGAKEIKKEKVHKIYTEYIGIMDGHSAATEAIGKLIELGYIAPAYVK